MTDDQLDPAVALGSRRAAALLLHFTRRDVDGMNVVLSEISGGSEMRDVLMGLCSLWELTLPMVLTPFGAKCVESLIIDLIRDEASG